MDFIPPTTCEGMPEPEPPEVERHRRESVALWMWLDGEETELLWRKALGGELGWCPIFR